MKRARACAAALALFAASSLVAASGRAGKKECAQSYVEAQKLMKAGSLLSAREQLVVCSRDECLAAVKKECLAWLDEVNAGIPSVVIDAKGPDGKDTVDVRLFIDGELKAEKLDVRAIEVEPGTRQFRFEMAGQEPIEREVIVRQGEKNKVIEASFAANRKEPKDRTAAEPANAEPASPGASPPAPDKRSRVVPAVLGGVAVVAIGAAGVFWYRAESGKSTLEDARCAPGCSPSDVDAIKRDRLIGDVLLGVGLISAGVAIYFLVAPQKSAPKSAAATWISPGGASVRF